MEIAGVTINQGTLGIALANLVALLFMLILYYNERKNN